MTRTAAAIAAVFVALALAVPACGDDDELAYALELIDFEIEDQFDVAHRRADYDGKIVVVIGSDRNGSQYNGAWSAALHDSLESTHLHEEKVAYLPVADTRGVPFFVQGMVKGKFPKEPERWTLLDWDGKFAKAYGWREDVANVVVFGPDGHRDLHVFGKEPHPEAMTVLVEVIRAHLSKMMRKARAEREREHATEAEGERPE